MRSDKMARLAGVTVRTVRHYHQIGLLREPERSSNGYRDYTAEDLAALVRITRFAELGIPLAEIGRVLDDPAASAALLEQIDAQAEAEIARLEARRREIAALRQHGAAPDLPVSWAGYVTPDPLSRDAARYEREQLALLSRFITADGSESFARSLDALRATGEQLDDLSRRFLALPADATDDQWRPIAEALLDLVAHLSPSDDVRLGDEAAALLLEHQATFLNTAQQQVVAWLADAASD